MDQIEQASPTFLENIAAVRLRTQRELINGLEVGFRDELDLVEEDVASGLGCLAGEDDEEAASLFVGFAEVLGGEMLP
ncbi:hypothetical protein M0R45_014438 [Rubus argutus]|uniref:Uncharacterized protein n=1 Tax=Rubus argutus TaxID=59490 RepID=A0AAW1XNV4_RUBAR